ncbi:MAG: MATE family efflux transporter [Kofleriaceae bacterium]
MSVLSDPKSAIPRQLFSLAMPIIGINVLNVMMLAVDSALCGRLPDSDTALAALGYSVQIIFLLMVVMLGLMVGTVALVARAYGGKAMDRVNLLLAQSTQLTVLVGLVIGVLGALLSGPILEMLGASDKVVAVGVQYLRPLMLGTPFFYLALLYAGVLRGVGNTRLPFLCALLANVINAVLNYGLVLGNLGMPALGVTGSAIGTVCAQVANTLALIYILRSGRIPNVRLSLRPRPIDRKLAIDLFRVGWPAAADLLVLNAGFLTAIGLLGRIDVITVAAHGLGLRVQALAFVPGIGVSQATGAMVGQALGAGDPDRARRIARASMVLCAAIMCSLAIILVVAAYPLVRIFDVKSGTDLEYYSVMWMYLLAVTMLPSAFHIALVGVLQGSGATRTSLWINIVTTIAIQIPLAWILGFGCELGPFGIWLSFPLSFVGKAAGAYWAIRRGTWAKTGVVVKA